MNNKTKIIFLFGFIILIFIILGNITWAQDWVAYLKTSAWQGFEVRSIELLTKEPGNSKTVKLHIEVPEEATSADYQFTIQGITKDQKIEKTLDIIIGVTEKKEEGQKGEYPLTFAVGSGENRN